MATITDSGSSSENPPARIPPATEAGGGASVAGGDEMRRWVEYAVGQAGALKEALGGAADSAVRVTGSGLSQLRSASWDGLQEAKSKMIWAKTQYAVYEDLALGKIKEGIVVAAAHPELSCGIAAGLGLIVFKRPRNFLIHNTRRIFVSEESLLADAEARVNELRQSVNLVKNESKKLEDRALRAEEEMERGRMTLIKEGREIQAELRFVGKIERQAAGLKYFLSELPRRDASRYHSEVSAFLSQAKKEKKALSRAATKIINYGISL